LLALHISKKYDCSYVTDILIYGRYNIFVFAEFISLYPGNLHSFIGYLLPSLIYTSCLTVHENHEKMYRKKELNIAVRLLKNRSSSPHDRQLTAEMCLCNPAERNISPAAICISKSEI